MDKIKRKIYLDKIIKLIKNDYPLFKNLKDYGFYDQLSNDEMDYVFSGVFQQPVRVKGYGYKSNGLGIYDENGKLIYSENSNGYWKKIEYDENGNIIYRENSNGQWVKKEYDDNGNEIYFENSDGYWEKREFDENGYIIYYEDSNGEIIDKT
jgi:hypothetical protein